jgi:hypothetical protein
LCIRILIPFRKCGVQNPVLSNGVYYEACINEDDAKAREKYLKSGMGKRYLKNRLKRFLSLTGRETKETK